MLTYLCDLDLEEIPCSFYSLYEEAKLHFPDGKIINDVNFITNQPYSYWTNPVVAYNLIKITFNKLKNEANELLKNKSKYDSRTYISRLLNIDICLYNLIFEWSFNSEPSNKIFRDPYRYFNDKEYFNFVFYFAEPHTKLEEKYHPLRIIDIDFDFSGYIDSLKPLERN